MPERVSIGRGSGRKSLKQRDRQIQLAAARKKIQMRIREVDGRYAGSSLVKNLRKCVLLGTYFNTLIDMSGAFVLFASVLFHLDWIELDVCTCRYHCDGEWQHKYTKTPEWNVTFAPGQCVNDRPWNCQVQGAWVNCVCNELGTGDVGKLLLNVNNCGYLQLVYTFLIQNGIIVVLGILMTTSMFKMSQYSPVSREPEPPLPPSHVAVGVF